MLEMFHHVLLAQVSNNYASHYTWYPQLYALAGLAKIATTSAIYNVWMVLKLRSDLKRKKRLIFLVVYQVGS